MAQPRIVIFGTSYARLQNSLATNFQLNSHVLDLKVQGISLFFSTAP